MTSKKVEKLAEDIQNLSPEGQAIVGMVLGKNITMTKKQLLADQSTDIFAFANQLLGIKEELFIELFFISKNYVPYATRLTQSLQTEMDALFIDSMLEYLYEGAETGMVVRDISYGDTDQSVLIREDLTKVNNADATINWIENQRDTIEYFNHDEHEFRNMKAVVARVTHKTNRKIKFHIVRLLESSKILSGGNAWQFDADIFSKLSAKVAFRVPVDNQVMIINNDIFVFNQPKFEKIFNYQFAKFAEADKKAIEFNKNFKISVPTGLVGIENFLRESDALLNKFLKADITLMDQNKVLEVADEMGQDLMVDDAGAIILQDKRDLNLMLDLMNDDYYESHATGQHYLAKSKKIVQLDGE